MGRKKVQIDTFFHFYGHFLVKSGLSTLRVLSQFWPKRVPPPKGTTGIRAGFLVPCLAQKRGKVPKISDLDILLGNGFQNPASPLGSPAKE